MRNLGDLEFLNGLRVEREILEEDGEYMEEEDEDGSVRKSRSPVKEQPSQEDMEDDDYVNASSSKKGGAEISINESPEQMRTQKSMQSLLQSRENQQLDLDPEDLEQIALTYDNIRYLRRKSASMKGNSDRQLASDFDNHLKRTMS